MDANGNIKPDKKRWEERVAGIVASIMALRWRSRLSNRFADWTGKGRAMGLGERLTLF